MAKKRKVEKNIHETELNEIDRELFGDEELEILQKKNISSEEEDKKREDILNNEFLNINENDFIQFDDSNETDFTKKSLSSKSSDSDVQIIEKENEEKEKKKSLNKNSKKKKNSPKKNETDNDDDKDFSCNITKQRIKDFKELRNKNIQKKIEKNKLIAFMLCWIGHILFLNNICNNKLLQSLIYSVYVNYKNFNNKIYKDPIYLFLFIKNSFELIIDSKFWISSDQILSKNIRGSIIFRIIRCIHRKRANNVIMNLIFICLCRCLNIPSRICITFPNLKNDIDIDNESRFIKKCYNKYYEDINKNIFFNHFVNSFNEESNDNEIEENNDLIIIDKQDFLKDKKIKKNYRNCNNNETAQFNIFSECYSTSYNKWISFFFCFNVYYFNFFNFSKNDNSSLYESKMFHILLPLPKNPEEIKTYKKAKTNTSLNKFTLSLFINKGNNRTHNSETSMDSSSDHSFEEKMPLHDEIINSENESYMNKDKRKNHPTLLNNAKNKKTQFSDELLQEEDNICYLNELEKHISKDKNEKFKILSDDYAGKMYIEKNNNFFIFDKKSKRVVRIIYMEKKLENNNTKYDYVKSKNDNIFDFEKEEEDKEIVNSLSNIYDTNNRKNYLVNQISALKMANEKLKKNNNNKKDVIEYDEIIYDKYANTTNRDTLNNKYIKVFINSNVYKYFYNLDNYNLYISINKYGILRDISVRHKLRYTKNSTYNTIIKGDKQCNIIRDNFRRISYYVNKKNYDHFEKVLDNLDDEYLYNLYVTNMIPKEKSDFLKSNYYILKSMLKKNQVIYPNKPVGLFKGENVYLKENFYNLMKREYLENKNYYISDSEKPLNYEYEEFSKTKIPLYAQFQLKKRNNKDKINDSCLNEENNKEKNNLVPKEENFDYIYDKKDKMNILKTKLLSHLKSSNIIELKEEDICIYNIELKYILKHIKGNIPYKIIYNNSYFFNKFRKKQSKSTDVSKIIIKKKHLLSFQNLYIPQKKIQDEFLINEKYKQIKNLWKVLCKSILYEQTNKEIIKEKKNAKNIYKMKDINIDVDKYFQI
ncbi:conserved Plasmodium protein, unknown function [Plasmodium gallinaceum]|uniref:Rad4 beta-hairpin domain-containing protein n=1 Tax=Plasmodium gallinaceum TaxID=5849 RepID=A0A1J1GTH3_PLAGA|nr:conserved Plasmodium protein, unknown function [Plasmodium gallinaceum]CRG95830.1 conserved Plasmodium protein, unknown function [Plasmodium gallinaceum]